MRGWVAYRVRDWLSSATQIVHKGHAYDLVPVFVRRWTALTLGHNLGVKKPHLPHKVGENCTWQVGSSATAAITDFSSFREGVPTL